MWLIEGLAWDWMGGNLYWTDSKQRDIEVYNVANDTRMQLVVMEEGDAPRALAVDPNTR